MYESEFFQDWLDVKNEKNPVNIDYFDSQLRRNKIKKKAESISKIDELPFSEQKKRTRENRQKEINRYANPVNKNSNITSQESINSSNVETSEVIYLPSRRNKKGNNK